MSWLSSALGRRYEPDLGSVNFPKVPALSSDVVPCLHTSLPLPWGMSFFHLCPFQRVSGHLPLPSYCGFAAHLLQIKASVP